MSIQAMDWTFYWLGYTAGVNSYRKVLESPDRIENLGEQVQTLLTEQQKVSFFIGLMVGRSKYVENLNLIQVKTTQGRRNVRSKGSDTLTLAIGKAKGVRGSYVDVALYIKNNTRDNRGVSAFQFKANYNADYLEIVSITKASSWNGTLETDISTSGTILAQGQKTVQDVADTTICTIRFLVKSNVPETVSSIPISHLGSVGSGVGSELLTLINNELYYITPCILDNGEVMLDSKQPEPLLTEQIASTGEDVAIGSTGGASVDFEFTATMGFPSGYVPKGGCSAYVNVWLNGKLIGQQRVPLQQGTQTYKGTVPLTAPGLEIGRLVYEIVVEPDEEEDEGVFYVFVKAGALFMLKSEVPREQVKNIPILPVKRSPYDYFYLLDTLTFTVIKGGGKEPVDLIITDNFSVNSTILYHTYKERIFSILDNFTVQELVNLVIKGTKEPINLKIQELIKLADSAITQLNTEKGSKILQELGVTDLIKTSGIHSEVPKYEKVGMTDKVVFTKLKVEKASNNETVGVVDTVTFTKKKV